MRTLLRRIANVAVATVVLAGAAAGSPGSAEARWHGGHHHGGGGWSGFGWGFAPGFAIGFGAPYYGAYYGGPYYGYGGECVMRRRWVINRWGHRVLRWTRVCY
jgi:hypothetical protein